MTELAPEALTANAGLRGSELTIRFSAGAGPGARRRMVVRDLYREIARRLQDQGLRKTPERNGGHETWRHADGRVLIVPGTQSRHTASAVMRQAGLPKAF